MPSTLVAVAAQAARSSAENARDSPEGLRPTAKIVAVCARVDGIGLTPTVRRKDTVPNSGPRTIMPKRSAKRDSSTAGINSYRAKRDFSQTPEPRPTTRGKRRAAPVFVVHRHEARRLHYDLRIEMGGVLKSWAVPKGFSFVPSDKRLAVRTEDHPLEYEHFDGMIPKGQYGAGTMSIWDRGHFQLANDADSLAALAEGKLELRLFGSRLRGEWHMVKMKKGQREWLLFKARDQYARGKDESTFGLDLTAAPRKSMPRRIQRMLAKGVQRPFAHPDWLFELKLAGIRAIAEKRGQDIRFRGTKRRLSLNQFGGVVTGLTKLKAENALLDGILVCLDDQSRPSRPLLEQVLGGQASRPIHYYAFDLLYYDEWDLRPFPLSERKAALGSILSQDPFVHYVDHERSRAEELIATVTSVGLPGVFAKRASSRYAPGESPDWVEIRVPHRQLAPQTDLMEALQKTQPHSQRRHSKVKFTNLAKVLWPRDGYSKEDLIEYYDQVADYLLPYLKGRPLSLKRYPDGIEGESFFQKHTPDYYPDWVRTHEVQSERKQEKQVRFVLCENRATLLYLANLAAMELHPWSSRVGSLNNSDWAIFDLDPQLDDFNQVLRVARALGKLLRGIGLRPYLKTSGSRGLHIYVPLAAGYTYDQARMFCEGVARIIVYEHGDAATIERVKERRGTKVYLDFLQNRRGQTIVAPFAVRPLPGATVSAPLEWDELSGDIHPSQFTIQTLPARLERLGDPFMGALTDRQHLLPAIEAIQDLIS